MNNAEKFSKSPQRELPPEFFGLQRFFPLTRKDRPPTGWNKPDNQKALADIGNPKFVGFDVCGHGQGLDFLFLDFDNVLDDDGNFVNEEAEKWFEYIQQGYVDTQGLNGYAEVSQSGHGIHIFALPTSGKFKPITATVGNALHFDKNNPKCKLEIFYGSEGRYCCCTGKPFRTESNTIAKGAVVDNIFEVLLEQLANQKHQTKQNAEKNIKPKSDISREEILRILDNFLHASSLSRNEWWSVAAILKYEGFDFETFDQWSAKDKIIGTDGKPRYNQADCLYQWEHTNPPADNPLTGASLIHMAKRFGYQPPRKNLDVYSDPEAAANEIDKQAKRDKIHAEIKDLRAQAQSLERDVKIRKLIRDLCEWKTDRKKRRTKIKDTQRNGDLIFMHDPALDKLFGYDELREAEVFVKKPPWHKNFDENPELTESDDAHIRSFLRRNYEEFDKPQLVRDLVTTSCHANPFNEIKDYFKSLPKWDGKPRAETFFIDWLNVDDTPFAREVTLKTLLGAVARVFHPGCEFQTAIVLHGNQKIGKGYLLKRLGGKWYKAISDRVDDPHVIDTLKTVWFGEFKEMAAMRKADINNIKDFIERPADTRRFSYERRARTVKRHCIFFITVNDSQFLADLTGNRRFLVLHSNLPKFGYVQEVRGERLTDDNVIAQIWAEVYEKFQEMFKDGFDESKLALSTEAEFTGERIAEQYLRDDGIKGEIAAALDQKILPPVIWNLLSKPERRQFHQNGGSISIEETDLITRFKTSRKRIPDELQAEFDEACTSEFVKRLDARDHRTGAFTTHFVFYGTEYRRRICVAEILNEFFEPNDKRKSPARIHEILAHFDGWSIGNRISRDSCYGDQKNVFYRDVTNIPNDDEPATNQPTESENESPEPNQSSTDTEPTNETSTATPEPTSGDYLQGTPLTARERDDSPFDLDQFE